MTKEELKQEAEEYYENETIGTFNVCEECELIADAVQTAYIDSAEPREKRIAELEAQIEKMKCCQNCDNWNWKHNKCEKKLKGDCFKASKWQLRR